MTSEDIIKLIAASATGCAGTGALGLWWFKRWTATVDVKLDEAIKRWTEIQTTVAVLVDRDEARKLQSDKQQERLDRINNVVQQLLAHTRIPLVKTED
jgi:hypothetical protein